MEMSPIESNPRDLNTGVPQASILGTILFLFFVNDSSLASQIDNTILLADDTTISIAHNDYDSLRGSVNLELTRLYNWAPQNILTLHADKT